MRLIFFLLFFSSLVLAQDKTPFKEFNPVQEQEYFELERGILQTQQAPLKRINRRLQLASKYNMQDDLIKGLEEKILLVGESAQLWYLLGGANGIKALQVNRMLSIPYVKAMLQSFERAIALNPQHLPALEAYIEALSMVPSLLGGDIKRAKQLAEKLIKLNTTNGLFSLGFIATAKQQNKQAKSYYIKAFDLLEEQSFCSQNLTNFFGKTSMNFSYRMAEISAKNNLSPAIGLCAIDYFIAAYSWKDNIPLEWAYFQKAQLLKALGKNKEASSLIKQSLAINPAFDQAKVWEK